MRLLTLALLCLLAPLGCGDEISSAPRSSFAACSFTDPCEDPEESCFVSQVCYPPYEDQPSVCEDEEGDRQCHRRCDDGASCGMGERCSQVQRVNRTDMLDTAELCFQ
ncbi:hypothetical protein [Pyxidicoccus trucidator]|uniref:hypothetical protein n=1 Tax=Pyxidicoccus trucidator TaxID=2709662 RepID=UPI0013D9A38F|nr:hypothetical protein [Pyxidicoccus trucidator]